MGVETLLIAGLVMTIASTAYSVYQSQEAKGNAKTAANKRADQEVEAARQEAGQIQERAARLKAMQGAGLAAAGVKLDSGTADVVLGETDRLSQQDALAVLKEGGQRADIIRSQGQLAAANYDAQSVATALGGASTILGGISSYQQATKGTRMATDINLNTDKVLATRKAPTYSLLGG